MKSEEFVQLNNAIESTANFLEKVRQQYIESEKPRMEGRKRPTAIIRYRNDANLIARMASETLDNEDMTISQRVSLKSSLSQLEFELRMLDEK